jgi:L-amino acid N-acyltransferase YncA
MWVKPSVAIIGDNVPPRSTIRQVWPAVRRSSADFYRGKNAGVIVRMATASDAPGALAIYGPVVESTAISFELIVPTVADMSARIVDRQPAYPWLVAEDQRGIIGYAYAGPFNERTAYGWSVSTSVYIAPTARGRGVGRALYRSLLAILSAQGYRQAMAGITLPNAASVALHEAMGFRPVGVYRQAGWKFGAS